MGTSILGIPTMSLISIICFIPAIILHEVAHGWMAGKMGDDTARLAGRLTVNPLAHIDLFGTVLLPLCLMLVGGPVFGYAKPVPYNPNNFKDLKKGEVLTGLAGPAANLLLGIASAILALIVNLASELLTANGVAGAHDIARMLILVCYMFSMVNFALCFFNLIPIPPLDGSSIIAPFLSRKALGYYYQVQRYALPILMVLLIVLPYFLNGLNPIGAYIQATAGNLTELLYFWL